MTTRFREFLCATTMLVGFTLITADAANARPKGIGISRSMMIPSMRAPSIRPKASMRMAQVRTFAPRVVMVPRNVVMPGQSLPKGLYQPNIPRLNGIPAAALPIHTRSANAKGSNTAIGSGPGNAAGGVGAAGPNVTPRAGNGVPPTAQNGPHISIAPGLQAYIQAAGGNRGWISTLPGRDGKLPGRDGNLDPPAAVRDLVAAQLGRRDTSGGLMPPRTEQKSAAESVAWMRGRPGSPTHGRFNDRSGQAAIGKWSRSESDRVWVTEHSFTTRRTEYNKEEGRTRETTRTTTREGTTTIVRTWGDEPTAPRSYSEHHEPANGGNSQGGGSGGGSGNKPDSQPNEGGRYTGPILCRPGDVGCRPIDPKDMLPGPGGMPREGETGVPVHGARTAPGPGAATDPCPDCDPQRTGGGGNGNGGSRGPNSGSSDIGWRPDQGGMVNPNGTLVNGGPVIPGVPGGPIGPPPR